MEKSDGGNRVINSLLRIFMIVGLVILVPKFFIRYETRELIRSTCRGKLSFGLENLVKTKSCMDLIRSSNCAVICDWPEPTGRTLPEVLVDERCAPSKLFLVDVMDDELGRWRTMFPKAQPVVGSDFSRFKKECSGIGVLLFDLQGMGLRADAATSLLSSVMDVAALLSLKLVILDVPNPLGGKIEGPGNIPFRPGVTLGELARYWNEQKFSGSIALTVVPVMGWVRNKVLSDLQRGRRKVGFSASIMSFLTPFHHVEPFSSFFDAEAGLASYNNHALMMPESNKLSGWELSYLRDMLAVNGVASASHVQEGPELVDVLSGLKIDGVENYEDIDAFSAFLKAMRFFSNRKTVSIVYQDGFDNVVGGSSVWEALEGKKTFRELKSEIEKSQTSFLKDIKPHLIYSPAPFALPMGPVGVSRAG